MLGTEPFAEYVRRRHVEYGPKPPTGPRAGDPRRWAAALARLPRDQLRRVESDLAAVAELAGPGGVAHLVQAARGRQPVSPCVPDGAPLALWFFLHRRGLFNAVLGHHRGEQAGLWLTARARAGLRLADLDARAAALGVALRDHFTARDGFRCPCAVEAYRVSHAACFSARVAGRVRLAETFGESGGLTTQRLRPARPVFFAYYPDDGIVLLLADVGPRERIDELLRLFGRAVLRSPVARTPGAFDLEALKRPFHPLPDAEDMELVRVKALHLRYPAHAEGRLLRLDTRVGDGADAIDRLLRAHVPGPALAQLRVCRADLLVRLNVAGPRRDYILRLAPDRCDLGPPALAGRFRLCLHRWGLCHG